MIHIGVLSAAPVEAGIAPAWLALTGEGGAMAAAGGDGAGNIIAGEKWY